MFNRRIPQAISMILLISALAGSDAAAQALKSPEAKQAEHQITALLQEFLANVDKVEMHDRFWAEDLIYTSGMGVVRTKADILKAMRDAELKKPAPDKAAEPARRDTYTAEDVTVRAYGDLAVLNFKLVQNAADGKTNHFRNSGTFAKRNGKWQVINWQATRISEPEKK